MNRTYKNQCVVTLAGITILGLSSMVLVGQSAIASSEKPHWGYQGQTGPEHWGEMSKEFEACTKGTRQSPIDIVDSAAVPAKLTDIQFHYNPVKPEIVNNGHTIQLNYQPGSYITVAGKRYDLLQFHFHSPSENTVAGKPYDMEMHLVHKSEQGQLAVVGVFMKQGNENRALKPAWDNMPLNRDQHKMLADVQISAADLLPATTHYVHFKGSLTTPPCSEGVNWYVLQENIEISKRQLAKFIGVIGNNARPVQSQNDRFVLANQ